MKKRIFRHIHIINTFIHNQYPFGSSNSGDHYAETTIPIMIFLFYEAGHVLKHSKKILLEFKDNLDKFEEDAKIKSVKKAI